MSPTPPHPDRRAFLLLGAGAAAALVTGCGLNNPFDTSTTPAAEAVRNLAPDVAAAVTAVGRLRTNQANLDAARAAHPALTKRLSGLTDLYRAHLEALVAAVPDGVDTTPATAPRPVPAGRAAALALVGKDAAAVQVGLVDLAVQARSGPFARLLGSMSAGLAQQVVLLQRTPVAR
ncbi:hypothetical protein [Nocardioides marmoriginsengisoli]|nr:hypothetical protein [Nocardioides marmoriginsengisoli]